LACRTGMVGAHPVRAVEAAGQIDQLATDLLRGECEKVTQGRGMHLPQRAHQTHQSALEDISPLPPAADRGMSAGHFGGQLFEAVAGVAEQLVQRRLVTNVKTLEPSLQANGLSAVVNHVASRIALRLATAAQLDASMLLLYPAGRREGWRNHCRPRGVAL